MKLFKKYFFIPLLLSFAILLGNCSKKTSPQQVNRFEKKNKDELLDDEKMVMDSLYNDSLAQAKLLKKKKKKVDYYEPPTIYYDNYIYKPNIKTVLLHRQGSPLSLPIIELNSGEKLYFSFDDLDAKYKSYKYTIVHCDAYWKPTDAMQQEYIDGFPDQYINDYKFSYNTIQKYIHYYATISQETLKFKWSGNYLLKLYLDENPDDVVITRRFMVFENKIGIAANVKDAINVNYRKYKQELSFELKTGAYKIDNPYKDLKIILQQNQRRDNQFLNVQPMMVKEDIIDYNFSDKLVFDGGNEFRFTDFRNIKTGIYPVREIKYDTAGYNVYMNYDEKRPYKVHKEDPDINGKFYIKSYDNNNSDIESEYCWVHLFMPMESPLIDGNIYVMGDFTNWQFSDNAKMEYDYDKGGYKKMFYLKQGYYNYQYLFLENGKAIGDISKLEGNHAAAENDYHIFVYHKGTGEIYDKLILYETLNSVTKRTNH